MRPILEKLQKKIGPEEWQAAAELVARGAVRQLYSNARKTEYMVEGDPYHLVSMPVRGAVLTDGGTAVNRYTAAAMMAAEKDGTLARYAESDRERAAGALMGAVGSALPVAETLKLETTLFIFAKKMGLELRTGEDRLYVVRDIPAFLDAVAAGKTTAFGRSFTYEPRWVRYSARQLRLLSLLAVHVQALETKQSAAERRRLCLTPALAKQVLALLEDQPFRLVTEKGESRQPGIEKMDLPVLFTASGSEKDLVLACDVAEDIRPITEDGPYFLMGGRAVRIQDASVPMMGALTRFAHDGRAVFHFGRESLPRVMGEVFPFLLGVGALLVAEDLEKRMIRLPLAARVYLDRDQKGITARTVFAYGPHEIDPFVIKEDVPPLLLRDAAGERNIMELLAQAGFKVRRGFAYMEDEDDLYAFISEGVGRLSGVAELYFSNEFKRLRVRTPSLKGRLIASGGRLQMEMTDDGTPIEELLPLLHAIRRRKGYFRFTDGTFLDLSGTKNWQPLAEAFEDAGTGQAEGVGMYHAAYLNALIHENSLPVKADSAVLRAAALRAEPAASPLDGLYAYQQRGFEWLSALYQLKMGGILADEMGLGKTVQTLAAIQWAKEREKERLPALVVTPTSLLYNWLEEIRRFAPGLRAWLIAGSKAQREKQLENALSENGPDIIVASYPVVRQDRESFALGRYRFLVLDEAQNIKNPLSLSAVAVKTLVADCRVALSGTPMENNVGELWSLFDFALPGYLPPLREFLRRYEDGRGADDLRRRLRPFLMRRLKSDVMSELPEKLETTLYAGMTEEQRRLYAAVLLKKRESVKDILAQQGLGGGRGEVLAAMTELREICCHPALVLDSYPAASGKEELLMEVLPPMLESGHRVLIFSQFTRMLRLIRSRLEEMGESPLYLDGDTLPKERVALAERFNKGEGRLFLISLKAGGTGLNLTGADTVIHYDPWWNPTAEDQATDRAHRLGQDKKVQVIRIVTLHSIEEKVVALGARKRRLFDTLITAGESEVTKLTDKDILALFEDD